MPGTDLLLSEAEIARITGETVPHMQRRRLTQRKWLFEEDSKGRPVVGRAYAEARLGAPHAARPPKTTEKTKVNLEHV